MRRDGAAFREGLHPYYLVDRQFYHLPFANTLPIPHAATSAPRSRVPRDFIDA